MDAFSLDLSKDSENLDLDALEDVIEDDPGIPRAGKDLLLDTSDQLPTTQEENSQNQPLLSDDIIQMIAAGVEAALQAHADCGIGGVSGFVGCRPGATHLQMTDDQRALSQDILTQTEEDQSNNSKDTDRIVDVSFLMGDDISVMTDGVTMTSNCTTTKKNASTQTEEISEMTVSAKRKSAKRKSDVRNPPRCRQCGLDAFDFRWSTYHPGSDKQAQKEGKFFLCHTPSFQREKDFPCTKPRLPRRRKRRAVTDSEFGGTFFNVSENSVALCDIIENSSTISIVSELNDDSSA
jgi:predicted Zn-ribbon and HTH transcriptional regulator